MPYLWGLGLMQSGLGRLLARLGRECLVQHYLERRLRQWLEAAHPSGNVAQLLCRMTVVVLGLCSLAEALECLS